MNGNIFNSKGIHVGVVTGAAIFDLKGAKLYDLKGVNIYRTSGELVGHLNLLLEHDLFEKPVPTFPDHALRPPGLLSSGSSTGKGRLRRLFCFDCEADHISVAHADLFISYRTFPQSGRAPRQSRPAIILRSGGFVFWIAAARPRSIRYLWSGVLTQTGAACAPPL